MNLVDEFPIPFVEDDPGSPVTRNVVWVFGGLSGLVVFLGLWLIIKESRNR